MRNNNFESVSVSEILRTAVCPDQTRPAPYLLVVEDERVIGETLGAILRNEGYAVAVTYDAESAIEIAELAPPEVVVTDVGLPGMNGVDLAFYLQELIPDCKVVLLTGMPEEAIRLLSARPGPRFRMFAKPIQPAELLKSISELLA